VHAQRVCVVLAYATSPLRPGAQLIGAHVDLVASHQYRLGGEATNAVCSFSAAVHGGRAETVRLWIPTL
jgi:hypothetical protein